MRFHNTTQDHLHHRRLIHLFGLQIYELLPTFIQFSKLTSLMFPLASPIHQISLLLKSYKQTQFYFHQINFLINILVAIQIGR